MENLDIILKVIFVYSIILTAVIIYKDNSSYFSADDLDLLVAGPVCWIAVLLVMIIREIKPINKSLMKFFDKRRKKKSAKLYNINQAKFIVDLVIMLAKRSDLKRNAWYKLSTNYVFYVDEFYGWGYLATQKPLWELLNKHFNRLMDNQHHLGMEFLLNHLEPIQQSDLVDCNEYWAERYNLGEYGTIYKFKKDTK